MVARSFISSLAINYQFAVLAQRITLFKYPCSSLTVNGSHSFKISLTTVLCYIIQFVAGVIISVVLFSYDFSAPSIYQIIMVVF